MLVLKRHIHSDNARVPHYQVSSFYLFTCVLMDENYLALFGYFFDWLV
jgi:hypothetical protein